MPESIRRVPMTQEKTQPNELAGAFPAFNKGSSAPDSSSISSSSSASLASSPSPSSPDIQAESTRESAINKELRRLNRALRALSACNQALAQAGSEQELLQQICDIIVRVGGYRMAFIAYAEQDEEKTVRPMAHAGHGRRIPGEDRAEVVGYSGGSWAGGYGHPGEPDLRDCGYGERSVRLRRGATRHCSEDMRRSIALPLRVAGSAFGVLAIYSEQAGSFESSEVELLTEMANNLAYGITAMRSQEEAKRATAALQEAEAKYRQLVEQVPAISYVAEAGAQGRFLYLSPQVNTILGYRPEDCLSDPRFWWNHLNPEDHPTALLEDSWEEGRPFQVEYRMRRQDGREVWLRDEAVIVRDPQTGKAADSRRVDRHYRAETCGRSAAAQRRKLPHVRGGKFGRNFPARPGRPRVD